MKLIRKGGVRMFPHVGNACALASQGVREPAASALSSNPPSGVLHDYVITSNVMMYENPLIKVRHTKLSVLFYCVHHWKI